MLPVIYTLIFILLLFTIGSFFIKRITATVSSTLIILLFFSCSYSNQESIPLAEEDNKIPNDWFFNQRAFPQGKINKEVYIEALRQRKEIIEYQQATRDIQTEWQLCGPTNIGGRLVDIEMPPNESETIYVGTAAGGIFKTLDLGQTWNPIFDEQPSLSIGDIALAPSDPNTIYVGTGEANAGGGSLAYDGLGVFKSTDTGATWADVGLTDVGSIGKVVIDPQTPDRVYVGAMGDLFGDNPERGVYRSENGGGDWEQVLFLNDSTGVIDMAIHPSDGDIVYAATWERIRRPHRRRYGGLSSGIYKTIDGGDNWTELTNNGLPEVNKGRIGLAIAPSNPNVIYAIYANQIGFFNGVYKSVDAGESWSEMEPPTQNQNDLYSSYGWWFGKIFVDPTDENVVYTGGLELFKSTDGANSWSELSASTIHVDQHAVFVHPQNTNRVICGNDGGLYISETGGNPGSWNHIDKLPITQFYTCEFDEMDPQHIYGGTQDNSSMRSTDGALNNWEVIYFGDGFIVLVDPEDNSIVYTEYQYGNLARSLSGGAPFTFSGVTSGTNSSDRRNWNTPVIFNPQNSASLYYGTYRLYKSTDHASNWSPISGDLTKGGFASLPFHTLTTMAVSPADTNIIYTGADDGSVHVTTNDGTDWSEIDQDLPERWITKIAAHQTDPMTAYATISGFRFNESLAHVFKTSNQGATWESISSNLPDVPVNDIILDPDNEGWMYLATDIGVFVSFNEGDQWHLLSDGLPNVPITDIDIHNPTRTLLAATYGRSMYKAGLEELSSIDPMLATLGVDLSVYPNPITEASRIYLEMERDQKIQIQIIDAQGKILSTIVDAFLSTGKYVYNLPDFRNNGTYFCVLKSNSIVVSKVLIKIK